MGAAERRTSPAREGSTASAPPRIHKPVDAWWTVLLVDPVAGPLTRLLGPVRVVTPTRVTVVAHALGLVCAALFATGYHLPAALLFEIRFVLDCVDGKLARLRGTSSNVGRYLDYVGDIVVVAANFAALGAWAWYDDGIAAPAAALLPLTFLLCLVCGAAREQEAATADVGTRRAEAERRLETGFRARLAAHRLRPLPGRVDVEHLTLFVAPVVSVLVDDAWPLVAAGGVACVFFSYRALKFLVAGLLIARSADRKPSP